MFKYEMHLHTRNCSACGVATSSEMAYSYACAGYSGIVLTDHFLKGNTAVDRRLPWADKMNKYHESYLELKTEGEKNGISVFFGLEYSTGRGIEFLTYGIDIDFLLRNPDINDLSLEEYCHRVHLAGGFVAQAHPFRNKPYIDMTIKPQPQYLDGIEVYNQCNEKEWNDRALALAKEYNLCQISGMDTHDANFAGLAGIACKHPITTNSELVRVL
ncbi:MAG: histidinol-phosphatase, partial [Oscillospiraceae bacterium]